MKNKIITSLQWALGLAIVLLAYETGDPAILMAEAGFIINPKYDKVRNWLTWTSGAINKFIVEELQDPFSWWQQCFNVFGWMKLTEDREFVITKMVGHGMLWQGHDSCAWTPGNGFSTNTNKVERPCKGKINEQYCVADYFNTCFKEYNQWDGRGLVKLSPTGQRFVNEVTTLFSKYAVLGAVAVLTAGGYFDPSKVKFSKKTPASIIGFFSKAANFCTGWLTWFKQMAKAEGGKYTHLNLPVYDKDNFSGDGKYGGDYLEQFDMIVEANPELQDCILNGAIDGDGVVNIMDAHSYLEFTKSYWSQCIDGNCINNRMRHEKKTAFGMTKTVYYIDEIPVVPISYPKIYTKYLLGQLRFNYVTVSRNIMLGMAFDRMPSIGDGLQGMVIQQGTTVKDAGYTYMAAHQLFGKLLKDPNLIAGGQCYVELKA